MAPRPVAAALAAAQPEDAAAKTLTEQAYTLLEEMIVRLELTPGSAVSEAHAHPRGADPAA